MEINFLDLKQNYDSIKNEVNEQINDVLEKCDFINGDKLNEFENNFASYLGISHFIGCANGTDALEIAIESLDLKNNDEIIVQGNTFMSTCSAVVKNNTKLVLCDVNLDTYMIDINDLRKKITPKTKVLIVVHLYGLMPDMDEIMKICKEYNIKLIEDCAQAHGATWKNKKAGSFGDLACFSFYPGKNMGAYGDGGGIGTNSDELNEKIRKLCNLGSKQKYHHEIIGRNSRLDTLQAAILNVKLKYIDEWNLKRRHNAELYNKCLSDVEQLNLPSVTEYCSPVYHLYVIQTDKRDELQKYLKEKGITCLIHYPISIAETDAMKKINITENNTCKYLAKRILSLPMYPELEENEIKYVCDNIKSFFFENEIHKMKKIKTSGKPGMLHCINSMHFNTKRIFYVNDFQELNEFSNFYLGTEKSNDVRGLHANLNFDEFMIVMNGKIKISLTDKQNNTYTYILKQDDCIFIPRMRWIEYIILNHDTNIMVMANETMKNSISEFNKEVFFNFE